MESFEPQHEDGIISFFNPIITILHALKDTPENCSHFRLSAVVRQSFLSVDVNVFRKMEKIEYCDLIKYLHSKVNTLVQIKAKLQAVYGGSALLFAIVKKWTAEFNRGHISLADDERSGRPTTATRIFQKSIKWY